MLIVEDEEDLRDMLAEEIVQYGYNTKSAANGAIALEMIKTDLDQDPPMRLIDSVICDLRMPTMNGFQLLDELNRINFNRPFIAMTADPCIENKEKAEAKGSFSFLEKPFNFETLKETLSRATQIGYDLNQRSAATTFHTD